MKNKTNVSAVVVSYNRKQMLVQTISALLNQSEVLKTIYIIDNNSTDGTEDLLLKNSLINELKEFDEYYFSLKELNKRIIYYKLKKNIGGAGGFNFGLKRAYEDKSSFNWFWLMDDDVEPIENALDYMLGFEDISECIIPSKKAKDGEILHWWGWLNLKNLREYPIPKSNYKNGYAFVNMMCFEGVLISRNIVDKIGFPDVEFFIYGDDVVYGYKASRFTKNIYLTKPVFLKKLKKKNFHKRFGKYYPFASKNLSYYLMRNYLLKAKKIKEISPDKINMIYIYFYHFYYFFKQILKAIFIEFSYKKVKILIKGFIHSFKF